MFGLFARKGPFEVVIAPSGEKFTVKTGDNLLKAALEAGIPWPHNCRVGSCGECKVRLTSGKIKRLVDFSYVLDPEELDGAMILACQTSLRSDIEVELARMPTVRMSQPKAVEGAVAEYNKLTYDIVEIGIHLDDPLPAYLAGQYADLSVPGVIDTARSYSFAAAPNDGPCHHVTFFVRAVPGGEMTTWLHAANRIGVRVKVEGPYGSFHLRDTDAPMLCVAGGSGLAPIKALLEQVAADGFSRPATFIFGARTRKDLYCLKEIDALREASGGRFTFVPVLSEEPEGSDWQGERGLCTEFIAKSIGDASASEAYLCGPPGMVDRAVDVLRQHGVSADHIYYDKFLDSSHTAKH